MLYNQCITEIWGPNLNSAKIYRVKMQKLFKKKAEISKEEKRKYRIIIL